MFGGGVLTCQLAYSQGVSAKVLDETWSTCFIKLVNFYWEWLQTPPVSTWGPWLLKLDNSNEVQGPEIPAESEDGVSTQPGIPATIFVKRDASLLRM